MNIGISGGARSVDRIIEQVTSAEESGFTSIWFPGAVNGDPLLAMSRAASLTGRIELGTAILQTYPTHPVAMAGRIEAAVMAAGRSLTIGLGPSHDQAVETMYGMSYDRPGTHTEDYLSILMPILRGESVDHVGEQLSAKAGPVELDSPVQVLIAALAPRMLRVAGSLADGTITWMADAEAVRSHVVPRITRAAEASGRWSPRVVVGVPVAVDDDLDAARDAAVAQYGFYGRLPNYQRILSRGKAAGPEEVALIGPEEIVADGVRELFEAGATDVWAAPFPVGEDRRASRARTRDLLAALANS